MYILGEGEDVFAVPVVRRGFAAISKVPPVMPAEAKSKGGGIWKFGCKGGVDVVVALVVIALVIFVATTASAVVLPVRCFFLPLLFRSLPFLFIFLRDDVPDFSRVPSKRRRTLCSRRIFVARAVGAATEHSW